MKSFLALLLLMSLLVIGGCGDDTSTEDGDGSATETEEGAIPEMAEPTELPYSDGPTSAPPTL